MRLFQDYMGLSVFSTKEFGEMGQRQEFRSCRSSGVAEFDGHTFVGKNSRRFEKLGQQIFAVPADRKKPGRSFFAFCNS